MLVLSRKESQRIRLGDSIVITIVKISGDKVRVGIDAPTDVLVLRDELEVHDPSSDAAGSGTTAAEDTRVASIGVAPAVAGFCEVRLDRRSCRDPHKTRRRRNQMRLRRRRCIRAR